jgi:hypothetical protein
MSNYEPELIWDDFVEGCACCELNYGLSETLGASDDKPKDK